MSENIKYRNICFTCKNAMSCTFQRDPQKSVFDCEEFDTDTCPSVKNTVKDNSPATVLVDPEDEDSSKFIGLCSNCNNHKACVFPKPQGGIWHCEEYQ